MPRFQPRLAIVGGGPSGLALARLMYQRGIRSSIFELRPEASKTELSKPSGMLDLHDESGLKAMRECGLWDNFQAALGDCTESTRVMNPSGALLHSDEGELSSRPEIARNALTSILLNSVPADMIAWGSKIGKLSRSRNATTGVTEVVIDCGAKGSATFDFVVGADGAWSRVRKLLTDTQPSYTGAQMMNTTIRHASTNYPHLVSLVGSGTLMAMGGFNALMTHRGPQDSIRLYTGFSTPHEDWVAAKGLEGKTAAELKSTLLSDEKLFKTWAPPLQDLITTACDEETADNPGCAADFKPLYMLPVGHRWEHQTGATLIGDAAHLMTPWAGEGVNLALWDALDLADALSGVSGATDAASWQAAVEPRLKAFEETMWTRAQEKAEESAQNGEMFLSENGGESMANFFKSFENEAAAAKASNDMVQEMGS